MPRHALSTLALTTILVALWSSPIDAGIAPPDLGALHLIAVGIDEYPKLEQRFRGAKADARAIAEFFQPNERGFGLVFTHVLLDEAATKEAFVAALERVAKDARPADTFLLTFSGMGLTGAKDLSAFEFMFADAPAKGAPNGPGRMDSYQLSKWLARVQAQRTIVLVDAGNMSGAFDSFASQVGEADPRIAAMTQKHLLVIGADGFATEVNGRGALTVSFLEALGADSDLEPRDELVTAWELEAAAARRMLELTKGRARMQITIQGGNFNLVTAEGPRSGAAPKPAPKAPPKEPPNPTVDRGVGAEDEAEPDRASAVAPAGSGAATQYPPQKRRDRAVLFATNRYHHWRSLTNPVIDAKAMAETLETLYGFEVELITDPNVDKVVSVLKRLHQEQFGPDDQLLIFFAGHGAVTPEDGEGYLLFSDSPKEDFDVRGALAHAKLRSSVETIPCEHILVVLDACFSGTFDPAASGHRGDDDPLYKKLAPAEFVKRKLKYKARLFITSGGKEYVPDGRPGRHSPFARFLLQALREQAPGDVLSSGKLYAAYLSNATPEPRAGDFGTSEPAAEFLFIAAPPAKTTNRER